MSDEQDQVEQSSLFEVEPAWTDHWRGMPDFSQEDLGPDNSVTVHFRNTRDREEFAKLVGQPSNTWIVLPTRTKMKALWFPDAEPIVSGSDKIWTTDGPRNPRYPVYVISKGRWESRLTSKAFEFMKVPYLIVVEPQEFEQYAAVIDRKKILVTPFSNLGLGGIPVRNFVWEHAVASGAKRHWIFDDNISGFCRFQNNMKYEVDSGVTLSAVEDWVDRYENVAMAAFNYDYFVQRKQGNIKPVTLNTRCYSGILLDNSVSHRWRGRYNEDTDLSLRLLKDGYGTALFNAFLMYKKPTLTMKGGNTDELYAGAESAQNAWTDHAAACSTCRRCIDGYGAEVQPCADGVTILEKDGRWRMAEHLREQHPDVTTVERKWERWQHQVDYRRFRNNELKLRPDAVIPSGVDDRGMTLVAAPEGWGMAVFEQAAKAPTEAGERPKKPTTEAPAPKKRMANQAAPRPDGAPKPSALNFATAARKAEPEPIRPVAPTFVKTSTEEPKKPSALNFALERKADGTQGVDRGLGGAPVDAPGTVNPVGTTSDPDGDADRAPIRNLPFDDVEPEVPRREPEPASVAVSRSTPASWQAADVVPDAEGVRIWLRSRGYKVVRTSDGFDVEDSDAWAPEDFAWFCNLDEAVVLGAVEPRPVVDMLDAVRRGLEKMIEAPSPETATPVDPRGSESGVSLGQGEESSGALVHVTPSSTLTLEEAVKRADAEIVIYEAPGLPGFNAGDSSLFDEPEEGQTLAQFLGHEAPRVELSGYVPDEPPDLTGIDEVVLNFATSGLDWHKGDRPGGLTVASMDGRICRFLPFRFLGGNLDEGQVKRWAEEQLRGKKIYNAKTKFDVHHSRVWGVDLEAQGCTFSDIQHTAALLDDHTKQVGLDVLGPRYLPDLPPVGRVDERRHLEHHAAEVAERERYTANLVWRLRDVLYPEMERQELMGVQKLEDEVIPAVVEMEKNGSPIDMELLERYGRECVETHNRLMMEISREAGFAFEHTDKGWTRLIESLHLTPPDGFSEAALNEVDHPLIRKGQKAKQYSQLNSKIFKAYPGHIHEGILRYDINQLANDEGGTRSGRFSIGIVQQVPNAGNHKAAFGDELYPRRLFVPGEGQYLEGDAAQEEFRLLVHYSGNEALLKAYRDDPKMSFHRTAHERLKKYKPDMVYEHVKSYNFAAQYGARSIKLAVMMGFITEREGQEIRQAKRWDDPRLKLIKEIEAAYKAMHPEAGELLDRASHLAKSQCDEFCKKGDKLHRQYEHRGFIKTIAGRRSRFPTNYKTYIALNRVLQGSGADIMKVKLKQLHDARKETGFVMRITNHDAVLGDALTPETAGKVSAILDEQSYPLKVKILWEVGTGPNWAECKKG